MPNSCRIACPRGALWVALLFIGVSSLAAVRAVEGQAPDSAKKQRPRDLPTVQVTASPVGAPVSATAQPTAILGGAALRRANAASIGETLEQVPGIRSLSMTSGIGKPVIRGLTNNRVVTLANGQRTETQQWGHDHSPNVESADAERIEVVKGPASVLYGSDALGGVVNVLRRPLPDGIDRRPFVQGRTTLAYNSAVRGPSATLVAEGGAGLLGWRTTGTLRRAGNLMTPVGRMPNSANDTRYGEIGVGLRATAADLVVTASQRDERIQIAGDPAVDAQYSGRQQIVTDRVTLESNLRGSAQRLQLQVGWERNARAEYDAATTSTVALGLRSATTTGLLQWHLPVIAESHGVLGLSLQDTRFEKYGVTTLIPNNTARALGLFAFQQRELGRWSLSAGVRHDWRTLETPGDAVLALAPQSRRFEATTGTIGAVFRVAPTVSLVSNLASGFRAPSASDLYARGFHEGTRAFEFGDPSVGVEQSRNVDLGVRVRTPRLTGEVTAFLNRIANYIFYAPVGPPGRALDSLRVTQGNAQLAGIEASGTFTLSPSVTLLGAADYVHAANTTTGDALPFVPPGRVQGSVRWESARGGMPGPYASLGAEWNARQTRTYRDDLAPPAWTSVLGTLGTAFSTPRGLLFVDLSVRNLANASYRDFMSRYKQFALAAGRTVILKVSSDF